MPDPGFDEKREQLRRPEEHRVVVALGELPGEAHAQLAADEALSPVAGRQVAGPDWYRPPGAGIDAGDGHAVVVLVDPDDLVAVAQPHRTVRGRRVMQERIEHEFRLHQRWLRRRGREGCRDGRRVPTEAGQHMPGRPRREDDAPLVVRGWPASRS